MVIYPSVRRLCRMGREGNWLNDEHTYALRVG